MAQATAAMLRITLQNPGITPPTLLVVDASGMVRDDMVYGFGARGKGPYLAHET